jgi:hypothetical protein|tara:strand:- start:743 stop:952 length:210 start_codon:yes stop_codon:yes gene_type:complete
MTSSTPTNITKNKGIIKSKPLVDLLVEKTNKKKELIQLKKAHQNEERQLVLVDEIASIEKFLSKHRIQK